MRAWAGPSIHHSIGPIQVGWSMEADPRGPFGKGRTKRAEGKGRIQVSWSKEADPIGPIQEGRSERAEPSELVQGG